jgi:hypothetical protein
LRYRDDRFAGHASVTCFFLRRSFGAARALTAKIGQELQKISEIIPGILIPMTQYEALIEVCRLRGDFDGGRADPAGGCENLKSATGRRGPEALIDVKVPAIPYG